MAMPAAAAEALMTPLTWSDGQGLVEWGFASCCEVGMLIPCLPACRAQIAELEESCNRQYATAEESAREWAEVTNNANIHKGEPSPLLLCAQFWQDGDGACDQPGDARSPIMLQGHHESRAACPAAADLHCTATVRCSCLNRESSLLHQAYLLLCCEGRPLQRHLLQRRFVAWYRVLATCHGVHLEEPCAPDTPELPSQQLHCPWLPSLCVTGCAPAGKWHEYWEEAKAHGDKGDKTATQHYEEMTAKVKDMVPDAIKDMVGGTDNEMHTSVRAPALPCDM